MKITEFIKKELSGWKSYEIIGLIAVFGIIIYNWLYLNDNPIAVLSAFCGILYTIIAGKGKISCYIFGLLGSVCYILLSTSNNLWGNALLYLGYYIPMQVHGIFSWRKNLDGNSNEIIKAKLKAKEKNKFASIGFMGCVATICILTILHDKSPVFDGITTFLSILGMYFTVKRLVEQWIVWIIVNGLSFIMWLYIVMNGTKAYSTLVMWGVYFIMAIYFCIVWKKEISNNNSVLNTTHQKDHDKILKINIK